MDWDNVLYVVFDLETTGRSRQHDEIIELAAVILDPSGIQVKDAVFSQLVKPNSPIPAFTTKLTSITNDCVSTAERFPAVGDAFIRFVTQQANEYSASHDKEIKHIIVVGHNGKVFDIPFFVQQLAAHQLEAMLFEDERLGLGIDMLQVVPYTRNTCNECMVDTWSIINNMITLTTFIFLPKSTYKPEYNASKYYGTEGIKIPFNFLE